MTPTLKLAAALAARGWKVAFLAPPHLRSVIESCGLYFLPLLGAAAGLIDAALFPKHSAVDASAVAVTSGADSVGDNGQSIGETGAIPPAAKIADANGLALRTLPDQWASLKSALHTLEQLHQGTEVVLIVEAFFYGVLPLFCSAPLPEGVRRPIASLCVSITAPVIRSVDLPPFGYYGSGSTVNGVDGGEAEQAGFDQSELGRTRNARLWTAWEAEARHVTALLEAKLVESGARSPLPGTGPNGRMVFMDGANYVSHDAILQIGVPGFEFPRSDLPAHFKIVGIVPPTEIVVKPAFRWWAQLEANGELDKDDPARKKVVVVAQGTVQTDPRELILPTVAALSHRAHSTLVVVILGRRGATISIPHGSHDNVLIADYLNYDAVLPFADAWIHNGGYGAACHGLWHGVPQVVAGDGVGCQDKAETGRRVAFSGVGIDLACAPEDVSVDVLRSAIEAVLDGSTYRERARELMQVVQAMDCAGIVAEVVLGLHGERRAVR